MASVRGPGGSWERSELFGARTRRHVDGGKGAGMEDAAVRAMREENDALIDDLEGKVEQVSRAASSINTEVRTSMDLLRSVREGVDKANTGVSSATDSISQIIQDGGGAAPLCKMVGIMVMLFVIVWWLFLR